MEVNKIYQGNVIDVLYTMPKDLVSCCVTSPPYWSLRDYGVEPQIWDGDKNCQHEWKEEVTKRPNAAGGKTGWNAAKGKDNVSEFVDYHKRETYSDFCKKCGAWRGALGLEPTAELYVKHMCDIFDGVKHTLRDDGVVYLNIGDTYISGGGSSRHMGYGDPKNPKVGEVDFAEPKTMPQTFPEKCLGMVPYRVALGMIARGWTLRNIIMWHKPNAMPTSVSDRYTVDFEPIFFFSKSSDYYFEQQFEKVSTKDIPPRIKRTTWSVSTKPLKEEHFAPYPEELVEDPIKAGCPCAICNKCGKPREKIIERVGPSSYDLTKNDDKSHWKSEQGQKQNMRGPREAYERPIRELGFTDCGCNAGFHSGVVLDPFMGSGTTAIAAKKLGRDYVGIDLNQKYIDIANRRLKTVMI